MRLSTMRPRQLRRSARVSPADPRTPRRRRAAGTPHVPRTPPPRPRARARRSHRPGSVASPAAGPRPAPRRRGHLHRASRRRGAEEDAWPRPGARRPREFRRRSGRDPRAAKVQVVRDTNDLEKHRLIDVDRLTSIVGIAPVAVGDQGVGLRAGSRPRDPRQEAERPEDGRCDPAPRGGGDPNDFVATPRTPRTPSAFAVVGEATPRRARTYPTTRTLNWRCSAFQWAPSSSSRPGDFSAAMGKDADPDEAVELGGAGPRAKAVGRFAAYLAGALVSRHSSCAGGSPRAGAS